MSDLFNLNGKVALVTGASSGLGVQFAKALARQGADIAICARRVEKLEAVKAEIEALGVRCYAHKCDVLNSDEIAEMVKDVIEHYGKIDILVNNAGIGGSDPVEIQSHELWNKVIGTNLNAAKPVAVKAVLLSTLGVVLTAIFTGLFCYFVLKFEILQSFLVGAVISSTDAASVFSILRSIFSANWLKYWLRNAIISSSVQSSSRLSVTISQSLISSKVSVISIFELVKLPI